MNFEHFPVYNQSENFNEILSHKAINYFLAECGGYIAGGLAEKEYNGLRISSYLKSENGSYRGDVDIYFTTKEGHDKAIEYAYINSHTKSYKESDCDGYPTLNLSEYDEFIKTMNYYNGQFNQENYNRFVHVRHVEPSCTDISHQVYIDFKLHNAKNDSPVKVQLIGNDFIGTTEEILNTFDFANVQIAYYVKNGQLFCCKRKEYKHDSKSSKLEVVNSHSPLLMHRIYKYLTHRGYSGVTEDSKQHIIDWLIRARSGHFINPVSGITLWGDALNNITIRRAISDRIIPDDALSLIIGKVITEKRVYRGYRRYDYVQIDEAMEAIKERSNSQNN